MDSFGLRIRIWIWIHFLFFRVRFSNDRKKPSPSSSFFYYAPLPPLSSSLPLFLPTSASFTSGVPNLIFKNWNLLLPFCQKFSLLFHALLFLFNLKTGNTVEVIIDEVNIFAQQCHQLCRYLVLRDVNPCLHETDKPCLGDTSVRSSVPSPWYLWHSSNAKQPNPTNRPSDQRPLDRLQRGGKQENPTRPPSLPPSRQWPVPRAPRSLAQVSQIFQPSLSLCLSESTRYERVLMHFIIGVIRGITSLQWIQYKPDLK